MTPGTTSADDQSVYGRDMDDSHGEVRDGADVGEELEERKASGEHDALEQLWSVGDGYEPTLSIKSAIEDGGSGSA